MSLITRSEFSQTLEQGWGMYLAKFQGLPAQAQAAFLRQQGYPSLDALLAHIAAWWEDGIAVIQRMQSDPTFQNPDYDVDAFNARAIQRAASGAELSFPLVFESKRKQMAALVAGLADETLLDERINTRLRYEIVVHMQEHLLVE
jgi:hypothetical protein